MAQEQEKKNINRKWLLLLLLLFGLLFYRIAIQRHNQTSKEDTTLESLEEQQQDQTEEVIPPVESPQEEVVPEEDLIVLPTVPHTEDEKSQTKKSFVKKKKTQPALIILRDFEKIKFFIAQDPIKKEMCCIKDFEILKNREQVCEDYNIYDNFVATDPVTKKMYRVGIVEQIKKTRIEPEETVLEDIEEEQAIDKIEEEEEDEKIVTETLLPEEEIKEDSKWKYLVLSIHAGGGPTFYKIPLPKEVAFIKRDQDFVLKIGISFPITIALHYTFFKRLIAGIGGEFLINHLVSLEIENKTEKYYFNPLFYQRRFFVMLGWHLTQNYIHNISIDCRLHGVHHLGDHFANFTWGNYINQSIAINLGGTYERKLNCYLKLMSRLGVEWYQTKDKVDNVAIKYTQPSAYLQIGLNFNFAKDTTGNNKKKTIIEKKETLNEKAEVA